MVRNILLSLIAIFSLFYIFFIEIIPDSLILTLKLIPMILIILLAILTKSSNAIAYKTLIIIALVFCAFGDYTLQWFVIGLSCFLVGHIFYIRAFLTTDEKTAPPWIWLSVIIYGGIMMFWIGMTLVNTNQFILTIAVCFYIIVILSMGLTPLKLALFMQV